MSALQEELEQAIGQGPDHPPVEQRVRAGRRALLVRRAVAGAATLAVVGTVGTTYAVTQTDGPQRVEVAEGRYAPTPGPPVTMSDDYSFLPDDAAAALTPDGLALRSGAVVVAHVDNPMGRVAPGRSLGLMVEWRGTTQWLLLDQDREPTTPRNGLARRAEADDLPGTSFGEWLADAVAAQRAAPRPEPEQPPVDYVDGELRLAEGVELLRRLDDPLPPTEAPGFDSVAVAVRDAEGVETWALLQSDDGGGFAFVDEATTDQTFDEWLADAVAEQVDARP